jgi:hypothetical protein
MILRTLRFLLAVLLLPLSWAMTRTMIGLLLLARTDGDALVAGPGLALCGGFSIWLFFYFTISRPVRTYVLAHELTHALWGALMGASISKMKVSKHSGSVTLSHTNFFITLAPYFFPLYTMLIIIVYMILSVFFDTKPYYLLWLGLVGFTWGFHFTFTISTLMQHQSDVDECGYLFSYVVIYLLNMAGICIWVIAVSPAEFAPSLHLFGDTAVVTYSCLLQWASRLWIEARHLVNLP